MKILRIVLGVLVALYGLFSVFPIYCDLAWSLGWWTEVPPDVQRLIPLWEATGWLPLAVWIVEVALFWAAAWRLLRGRLAFVLFVAAMVAEAGKWATMKSLPVYRQAFTPAELQIDYYSLAALVVIGALIWWSERKPASPVAA